MSRIAPRARNRHRNGGWSLLELAVVLAVIAVLGLVLWRVLPLAPKVAEDAAATNQLASAEQALLGYALAHHRLPSPVSVDGLDMLPVEPLGLPSRLRLRYQVQGALTAAPGDSFVPLLPPAIGGGPTPPSGPPNGLDLCIALKGVNNVSLAGMQGVPTAFALMHAGPAGHDNQASEAFVLPGSTDVGQRQVLATGPGEFASRLGCPDRISRANAAARAAYASYDLARVADNYKQFRDFAIQVAEMNKDNAETGIAFAAFDIVWGVFIEAIAILQEAAGWPPDALGIATGIAAHASATAQLAIAIVNEVGAVADMETAKEDLAEAKEQAQAAAVNVTRMQELAKQSLTRAQALDQNGLQP